MPTNAAAKALTALLLGLCCCGLLPQTAAAGLLLTDQHDEIYLELSSGVSYHAAKAGCEADPNKFLASVRNQAQWNAIYAASSAPDWYIVGALEVAGAEGMWKWVGGRFADLLFDYGIGGTSHDYNGFYTQWAPGEPNNANGLNERWMFLYATGAADIPETLANTNAYYCVKHKCNGVDDCNNHSSSVSGYWPDCACTCDPGFTGPNCTAYVLDQNDEITAYTGTRHTQATAAARCSSEPNTFLASVRNAAQWSVVAGMAPPSCLIGGSDALSANSFYWMAGRWAGRVFSIGNTSQFPFSVAWAAGEPFSSGLLGSKSVVELHASGPGVFSLSSHSKYFAAGCYFCVRHRCNRNDDCNGQGAVVGVYWPNCTCACDSGFTGAQCERFVDRNETVVRHNVGGALGVTQDEAESLCAANVSALATVRDAAQWAVYANTTSAGDCYSVFLWLVERRLRADLVPTSTVWTHITAKGKMSSAAFAVDGSDELLSLATQRVTQEDEEMVAGPAAVRLPMQGSDAVVGAPAARVRSSSSSDTDETVLGVGAGVRKTTSLSICGGARAMAVKPTLTTFLLSSDSEF